MDFDPRVRIALCDGINISRAVIIARLKSVDDARGDSLRAEHDGHCRRKVFAVAFAHVEQKVCERVKASGFEVERIAVIVLQMLFDGTRRVVLIMRSGFDYHLAGEASDAWIEIVRELEVACETVREDTHIVQRGLA